MPSLPFHSSEPTHFSSEPVEFTGEISEASSLTLLGLGVTVATTLIANLTEASILLETKGLEASEPQLELNRCHCHKCTNARSEDTVLVDLNEPSHL